MSAISNILSTITRFLGGIFGFITSLFKKKDGFYLEVKDAKKPSTKSVIPAPEMAQATSQSVSAQAVAPEATVPSAPLTENEVLNLPEPEVSTIEPLNIPKFGAARRPGANMKAFLDMAKVVKS